MVAPADLYELPTRKQIKDAIIGYAEAAESEAEATERVA